MAPTKASAPPYSKDEKVLCFHHEMLYEAKILEVQQADDASYQYKIHYKGWKNTWDDWVPQDRIRKFNEENRELAHQLTQQARASLQKSSKPAKKVALKGGSDFSSARGSEERTGGSAAMSGRGPARRARDYEMENDRAEAPPEPSAASLDIYDMKNWGGATTSDWAKKEAQWAKQAHTQGYSHFKTPEELGYRSEAAASKRYSPKLNKKGEWEQSAPGLDIHRTTHTPFEKPETPPKAVVAPQGRAVLDEGLREQAAQYDERTSKELPRPAERRQRLRETRVAAAVEPTRKSRVRAQPFPATMSAAVPTTALNAVKSSALPSIRTNVVAPVQLTSSADTEISDNAVLDPSATVVSPVSPPTLASSSRSATSAVAAPVTHTTSDIATDPRSHAVVPSKNAAIPQAESTRNGPLNNPNPDAGLKLSNGNAHKNKIEDAVTPVAFSQGLLSGAIANKTDSQIPLITWKMDAALALKVQSLLSGVASVKQEDDDSGPAATAKAFTGKKRKAEDDDSKPAKKVATGQIFTRMKRKATDKESAPRKRPRVQRACKGCRHWRVKCDGGTPCSMCSHRGIECVYVENEDAENNVPGAGNTSKSAPKPSTSKAGPSGTKKTPAPPTAIAKPSKPAAHRPIRGPVCNKCREKKTGCDRGRPCKICNERGWECVYESLNTADQLLQPSGAEISSSGALGNNSTASNQKTGHTASASSKQVYDLSCSSPAQASNSSAEDNSSLKRHREDDQIDGPAAKRSKTVLDSEMRLIEGKPAKLRFILPAISEWIVKGEHGFREFGFNKNDFLTKRQMEKRETVPEGDKQDLTNSGTTTNNQYAQEESFHSRPSIKLVLPDHLKGFLVDDWENVTKNGLVVELPHSKATVDQILKDYVEYEKQHRQEGSAHMDILVETIEGLREYFDKALARILLYRFERLQWAEISKDWTPEQTPSTTYGAEHLCRLLVSLPELVAQTNMDAQSVSRLREELTKFTNWLEKRTGQYFLSEYINPGPDYADKARG